jgi:hypothetical protein
MINRGVKNAPYAGSQTCPERFAWGLFIGQAKLQREPAEPLRESLSRHGSGAWKRDTVTREITTMLSGPAPCSGSMSPPT